MIQEEHIDAESAAAPSEPSAVKTNEFEIGHRRPLFLGLIITGVISCIWTGVYYSSRDVTPYFVIIGYYFLALVASPLEFYYLQLAQVSEKRCLRGYLIGSLIVSILTGILYAYILFLRT